MLETSPRLRANSKREMYAWINEVLNRFRYFSLRKKDKGLVRGYIRKMTDLSQSQLTRTISKKKEKGIASLSAEEALFPEEVRAGRHFSPRQDG